MANNTPNAVPPVRVLKKVRRQFLHKTPEEVEPNDDASANNHNLMNESDITKETIEALKHSKKLCIEAEELNSYFHVTSALIESRRTSRVVTLNLCRNDGAPMPWEHTARKLESLGDLESATWALRIRTSLLDYVKAMTSFHEMLKSEDPLVQATLRKTQRRAVLACREIEEKYSFQKYLQHLRRDTYELLSCHYTDGFIQEIGHTPETFLSWSRENGIPKIFETNNEFYQNLLKEFLSFLPLVNQPIREGERMEIIIYDKDGMQQKMRIKTISVFEPNPAMSFHHWYIAVDKDPIVVAVQAAAQGAQEQQNDPELQLKKRIEDADETKENTEQ